MDHDQKRNIAASNANHLRLWSKLLTLFFVVICLIYVLIILIISIGEGEPLLFLISALSATATMIVTTFLGALGHGVATLIELVWNQYDHRVGGGPR